RDALRGDLPQRRAQGDRSEEAGEKLAELDDVGDRPRAAGAAQERVHVGEDLLDRVAERDAIEALLAQESRDGVLAGPLAAGEPDQDGAHGSGSPTGSGSEVRGRRVARDGHVVAVQAVEVARGVDLGADVVRLRRAEEVELLAAALGFVAVLADESGGRGEELDFRSEEHTSELQSRFDLVCRLLLEKKKRR